MLKILIVRPHLPATEHHETPQVATGNYVDILDGHVTRAMLAMQLKNEQYDGIHFIQDGGRNFLVLSDGNISVAEIREMVCDQHNLHFVFINACNSAGTAAELHNQLGISVIAHQSEITSQDAVRFAEVFYRVLGGGVSIMEAYKAGRDTLYQLPGFDGNIPVLIDGSAAMSDIAKRLESLEIAVTTLDRQVKDMHHSIETVRHRSSNIWILTVMIIILIMQAVDVILYVQH